MAVQSKRHSVIAKLIGCGRIKFIQFHQNYAYADFVMGYKPCEDGFKLADGIFYQFCKLAKDHPDQEYFFIIDEINRGNMSKIFGELLMLIEKDYRDIEITLSANGMPFSIPPKLYIIGMMNTADRSLAMIDYALRRRFSFYTMEPGFHSDGFRAYQASFLYKISQAVPSDTACFLGAFFTAPFYLGIFVRGTGNRNPSTCRR